MKPVPRSERPKQNLLGCYLPVIALIVGPVCCIAANASLSSAVFDVTDLIIPILLIGTLPVMLYRIIYVVLYRIIYVVLYRIFKRRRVSNLIRHSLLGLLRVIFLLCPPLLYRLSTRLLLLLRNRGVVTSTVIAKIFSALTAVVITLTLAWFIYLNFVMSV